MTEEQRPDTTEVGLEPAPEVSLDKEAPPEPEEDEDAP